VTPTPLTATTLWGETSRIPEVLETTVTRAVAEPDLARFFGAPDVHRIVATGNGAAYYVALSLQMAALMQPVVGLEVIAIPAGLLGTEDFTWQPNDRLLAISSSGEIGDVIAALERDAPTSFGAITATPESTIGRRATSRTLVEVASQDSATHTQGYVGNVAAALILWAQLSGDEELLTRLAALPAVLAAGVGDAPDRVHEFIGEAAEPVAAIAFGSGAAWPAALETALLLKEVAAIPAEGMETREGATSGMYALSAQSVAISVSSGPDPAVAAAEDICRSRGAAVMHLEAPEADARLVAATVFPYATAVAGQLGIRRGLDVDHPPWLDAYYAAARIDGSDESPAGSTG